MIPVRQRVHITPLQEKESPHEYWNDFDRSIHLFLSFVTFVTLALFLSAMIGIPLTGWVVLLETIFISLMLIQFIPNNPFRISQGDGLTIGIVCLAVGVFSFLSTYFTLISWDGALFLLNSKMLITQTPILNAFYKPLTWSAFLTLGLNFGLKEVIPILTCVLVTLSTYLFALTLSRNRVVAQLASLFSIFIPLLLLWGLSYYAETFLLFLLTFGFANYFHSKNTGKNFFYGMSIVLFALAFLTKYSTGVIFLLPLYDSIRERKFLLQFVPAVVVIIPFLIYQWAKARDPFYAFTLYSKAVEGATNNLFTNAYYLDQMNSMFTWPLLLLSGVGLVYFLRKHLGKNILSFLFISGIMIFYLLFFLKLKDIRYFVFIVPLVATMVGYLIIHLSEKLSHFFILKKFHNVKMKNIFVLASTGLILILLVNNYQTTIFPQYKHTGSNIALEAAQFLVKIDSRNEVPIMSNSHVVMSWYLQRKVWNGVPFEQLSDYLAKNGIRYIVNFEHSGTPAEMKDTKRFNEYGKIIQTYTDGFEKINIIQVNSP